MAILTGSNLDVTARPMGNVGFNHSRVRVTSCQYAGAGPSGDELVVAVLKSNDRIRDIRLSSVDTNADAGTVDVGFWTADTSNNGLALTDIDQDRVATAVAVHDAVAYGTSIFEESGTLTLADRGKMVWEQAGLSSDPGGNIAVVAEFDTAVSGGDGLITILAEVEYVAGD